MSAINPEVDVLVIGAGPSGSIAAAILHKAGLNVQVVEKLRFPRFVIGESLLPRCMEALEEAGLLEAVRAQGFQQKNGAKFFRGDKVCDFNFSQQYTPGWNHTWQVQRARFDKALADECERKGIPVHYETEVTGVDIHEDGTSTTTVKTADGGEQKINARFIVDGSGYGRVLPTLFGLNKQSTQYTRRALFSHFQDPIRSNYEAAEPNRIWVVVHQPTTWIWVIPFSDGTTSVGFVGSQDFFDGYTGSDEEKLRAMIADEPNIAERFKDAPLIWEAPKILQGWSATTDAFYGKGFVLTGNVTEFLDPVFSSGVTLASVSAQTAANLVVKHLRGEAVDWAADYQRVMETGVSVFRTYVDAWYDGTLYKIFFNERRDESVMNKICSVLAGYVWDMSNPFVRNSEVTVRGLARVLEQEKANA